MAKIVIKEGTGTLYYTLPFPNDLYMPGYGNLDLRGKVSFTRHIHRSDIPLNTSTESALHNPDKVQLRADILAMRERGMSYRKIGTALGIHWTQVERVVNHAD